jgi:putative ABC transport system permease protein
LSREKYRFRNPLVPEENNRSKTGSVLERYKYILTVALEAVLLNKSRSILTMLGIIFGVAAVIAMMAIGRGAQKEILDQMKLVGVNNIIITPLSDDSQGSKGDTASQGNSNDNKQGMKRFSPGLTLKDAVSIQEVMPNIAQVSPEVSISRSIVQNGKISFATVTGVTPAFFKVFNIELASGSMFSPEQALEGKPVCIIGEEIRIKFFPKVNPIGKNIKCGKIWLEVIGVLKKPGEDISSLGKLGISDYNNSIYTPIQTILLRFIDRSFVNPYKRKGKNLYSEEGMVYQEDKTEYQKNQLDKIVVQVTGSEQMLATDSVLKRMIKRRHNGMEDFQVKVPELLLKQEKRTRNIFNFVLGAIASISLLVGGIGIMNIMLASVMERIKEIGIRQAIGATRKDIAIQFLAEATLISLSGGFIGILLGIVLAEIIHYIADIRTIITALSIIVSFGVSVSVGIIFGLMPARKASSQDPVTSLRYE